MKTSIGGDGFSSGAERWARASRRWRAVVWLWAAISPALVATAPAVAEQVEHVRVLLRYDDYTRESSAALERALLNGLHQSGVPLLVGVVPFLGEPYPEQSASSPKLEPNLGLEKIARLRELLPAGNVEIALHGFSHRVNFRISRQDSEFAGLSLERQRQLLALGRTSIEQAFGAPVRVFTPPYNSFDGATLIAMRQTGFRALSAGLAAPDGQSQLVYMPGTIYPQKMRSTIQSALRDKFGTKFVVVVMHPYDFVESDDPMPPFRKLRSKISVHQLLDDIRWAMSQPGVRFISLSSELAGQGDLSAMRMESNARLHNGWVRTHALLPGVLASPRLDGALLPTDTARALFWKENVLALFVFSMVGIAAFVFSRWINGTAAIGRRRGTQRKMLAGMLPMLVLVSWASGFYFAKAALLVFGLGWYAGTHARA